MRRLIIIGLISAFAATLFGRATTWAQSERSRGAPAEVLSQQAEFTRTKLLKVKVSVEFKDARMGDVLKELAALVEMKSGRPIMWTYATGFPFEQRVAFSSNDSPVDSALDQLLTQVGAGTGYVIVSKVDDKHDGWIRLTTNSERGTEQSLPSGKDEQAATERLMLAKKLIEAGKPYSAKPLLEILVRKYAATKAGMEAMVLLEKLDK